MDTLFLQGHFIWEKEKKKSHNQLNVISGTFGYNANKDLEFLIPNSPVKDACFHICVFFFLMKGIPVMTCV